MNHIKQILGPAGLALIYTFVLGAGIAGIIGGIILGVMWWEHFFSVLLLGGLIFVVVFMVFMTFYENIKNNRSRREVKIRARK